MSSSCPRLFAFLPTAIAVGYHLQKKIRTGCRRFFSKRCIAEFFFFFPKKLINAKGAITIIASTCAFFLALADFGTSWEFFGTFCCIESVVSKILKHRLKNSIFFSKPSRSQVLRRGRILRLVSSSYSGHSWRVIFVISNLSAHDIEKIATAPFFDESTFSEL